jgi:hypothetical protein
LPRRRTTRRKTPNPRASWLVAGRATPAIVHHGQQAYLLPHQASHHPKRYRPGQTLDVKPYVPGPTQARVTVTEALGPDQRFRLGQVTDQIARELGYEGIDTFRLSWIETQDDDWVQRAGNDAPLAADAYLERFEQRWAPKLAWLIRFKLDNTADPHLLAARSDELYVTNPAMALHDELPALRPDEWQLHIAQSSPFRERARLREQRLHRESQKWQARLTGAQSAARAKGYDIRDECRLYERLMQQGHVERAKAQLALIEARVYPVAA